MIVKHIKSGKLYRIQGLRINATNRNDGNIMVDYSRTTKFTREINEFCNGRFVTMKGDEIMRNDLINEFSGDITKIN